MVITLQSTWTPKLSETRSPPGLPVRLYESHVSVFRIVHTQLEDDAFLELQKRLGADYS